MKRPVFQLLTGLVLVAAGLQAGCGFLDTRNPVVPPDTSCLNPLDKISPQNVLANHVDAIGCKVQGTNQFRDTMNETRFLFRFDLVDAIEIGLETIPRSATVESYRRGVEAIADSIGFEFADRDPDEQTVDRAFYDKIDYTFRVVSVSDTTVLETYSGMADITLETNDFNQWEVVSWVDFSDGTGNPTWGSWLGSRVSAKGSRARLD